MNAPDLSRLSATKLQSRYDRLFAEGSAICRELIAAGYGSERQSETRARAAEGDAIACRYAANTDAFNAVVQEMGERKRYHGDLRPIRRAA